MEQILLLGICFGIYFVSRLEVTMMQRDRMAAGIEAQKKP